MIDLKHLQKINDYTFEISSTYRSDMRVPARVYATEQMLKEIATDRSLNQLVNVATLPGIQKYAISMPDIHEGYGFPIGGVAAFDLKEGIISPGGIGYDINCLHPNTKVLLNFGSYIPIKNLNKRFSNLCVSLIDKKNAKIKEAEIINFLKRKNEGFLYKIRTKFGSEIKATADHPFFDGEKMVEAHKLIKGSPLIANYFNGVEYQDTSTGNIINKNKILKALKKLGLKNSGNRWQQILKWFHKKNFISLSYNSYQTPYLIKILGFLFGDGTANLVGKQKTGLISFYGKKEDLISLKNDLNQININAKIYTRKRKHKITNLYNKSYKFIFKEHRLQIKSTSFVILLYLLGMPLGNKTKQRFTIPVWIKNAPLYQQRLFLAAFFGAEMSSPRVINKYSFASPTININKSRKLLQNGVNFLNDLRVILRKIGVRSHIVKKVDGLSSGETVGLRFQIANTDENLLNFFKKIGFEYNFQKQRLSSLAAAYLSYKIKILNARKKVRQLARSLYVGGLTANQIVSKLADQYYNSQFIEHSIWSTGRDIPRIALNFPGFKEFINQFSFEKSGLVFDEVEEIEKIKYNGFVYDITVNDPNHNFIANNIVVSNCGVRLLKSKANVLEISPFLKNLGAAIFKEVPSGVGRSGMLSLNNNQLDQILQHGAQAAIAMGYGKEEDLKNIESNGKIEGANPAFVSSQAKMRGHDQLGTMGAGNHFVEVQLVETIFDDETAKKLKLFKGQVVILIHTGSRGLGHQVATDYIRLMMRVMPKYKITLPDRELACVPFKSQEGQNYFKAMAAAANFAFANRQLITFEVRQAWKKVIGSRFGELEILYDVAHNIAKIENNLLVHRKGATRAFPEQIVLIPGSMGSSSYILVGQEKSLSETFGSTCHGAGRRMSRSQAKREIHGGKLKSTLENQGIVINAGSLSGLAEEAPNAYKNVDEVVEVVHQVGIAKKIARLKPLAVIKG